jgi:hypothetical protein
LGNDVGVLEIPPGDTERVERSPERDQRRIDAVGVLGVGPHPDVEINRRPGDPVSAQGMSPDDENPDVGRTNSRRTSWSSSITR